MILDSRYFLISLALVTWASPTFACQDKLLPTSSTAIDEDHLTFVQMPQHEQLKAAAKDKNTTKAERIVRALDPELIAQSPAHPLIIGHYLVNLKMWPLALEVTDLGLKKYPQDPRLLTRKTNILHKQGNYKEIVEFVTRTAPLLTLPMKNRLLKAYYIFSEFVKAKELALEIITDPEFKTLSKRLQEKTFSSAHKLTQVFPNDIDFKETLLHSALELSENKEKWLTQNALVLRKARRDKEAADSFHEALKIRPLTDAVWAKEFNDVTLKHLTYVLINVDSFAEAKIFAQHIRHISARNALLVYIAIRQEDCIAVINLTANATFRPVLWARAVAFFKLQAFEQSYEILLGLLKVDAMTQQKTEHVYNTIALMQKIESQNPNIVRAPLLNATLATFNDIDFARLDVAKSKSSVYTIMDLPSEDESTKTPQSMHNPLYEDYTFRAIDGNARGVVRPLK